MFDRIKHKWPTQRVKPVRIQRTRGQSLVEMAIISPLLLLLFIGVLEVGYAIRSYVVLVNADREATRFAARGLYLDFSQTDRDAVGYGRVLSHTLDSIAQQLPFDVTSDEPNGTLIVSHYVVDTGRPCKDPPCNDTCPAAGQGQGQGQGHGQGQGQGQDNSVCDCSSPERREEDYPDDDWLLHPGKEGYEYFTKFYGIPRESRINYEELVAQLKEENDAFNCALNLRDPTAPWSVNSGIIVETFYTQYQLLGVPIISNHLTDPYELYAHTVFRLPDASDVVGCRVYPIALRLDKANATGVGELLTDGWDGTGDGNFGWLSWNPDERDAVYLRKELEEPALAGNEFTDVLQFIPPDDDHELNAGDDVAGITGVKFTVDEQIQKLLIGTKIIIPVWDPELSNDKGANSYYRIVRFVQVIVESPIDPSSKAIALRMDQDPANVCPGNGW